MFKAMPAREMRKAFRQAGWTPTRGTGSSHTKWLCPSGRHHFSLPDGHQTISAGVVRGALRALEADECEGGER